MMNAVLDRSRKILETWKGPSYTFGRNVLQAAGPAARPFGEKCLLVVTELGRGWIEGARTEVESSLRENGVRYEVVAGARPNAPREDLYRISLQAARSKSDFIIAFGGGSTIDAAKAAAVLNTYAPSEVRDALGAGASEADGIEPYFGTGLVSRLLEKTGKAVMPVLALQTAASSGAHLTKYANITDPQSQQKKLIVDEIIVPPAAVFDYGLTASAPFSLSVDGGLDGMSHAWEVFMSARGSARFEQIKEVAELCLKLIIFGLGRIRADGGDVEGRTALGLGTDLGGYAIMMGGTSGPHLGSFSLIDLLSHGRACALLLPYYTVLFASVIQEQLRAAGPIFIEAGYLKENLDGLEGKDLGLAVARGMIAFLKSLDFPTTLQEAGASEAHLRRMLSAAKDPALKMKLQNMPTPMDAERGDVDRLMKPVLEAAYGGDLTLIP
jgi:alcohol dehydrogenase